MKTWFLLPLAFLFAAPAIADVRVTVAADGSGQYTRLQDALNAIPSTNSAPYIIDIKPGTYSVGSVSGQFMVDSPKVTLNGLGTTPSAVVITGPYNSSTAPNDKYQHATVVVIGSDFTAKNVTFANTAGDNQGQALAVYAKADRLAFLNCRFLGWQDTLRAEYGRQFYENCYIEGDVDFIYGHTTGYFKNCQLYVKSNGYVTAPDTRTSGDNQSKGFVFQNCTITGATNNTGLLGRPWNAGGLSVFLNTKIGPVIKAEGWGGSSGQATFAEYKSTDLNGNLLNVSSRVSWSQQLSDSQIAPYSQSNWLSGWNPPTATTNPTPSTPSGLSATAGNTQIALSWSASSNATSYNIKRSTTSGSGYSTIGTATGTSFTNTGLANGTYYYVVSAVNSGGESANSSQASATINTGGTSATIEAESGSIAGGTTIDSANSGWNGTGYANFPTSGGSLQFNNVNGGSGGTATITFRFTVGGSSSRTGNLVVNGVTQTITFPATTTWTAWTNLTVNVSLNSDSSNTIRLESTGQDLANIDQLTITTTANPTLPAAPQDFVAQAYSGQVALGWSPVSGATSYNVKRATTSGGPYTTIATTTGTEYLNTGLTNGTTYHYAVSAVSAAGESPNSAQASATPSSGGSGIPAVTLQAESGTISGGTFDSNNVGFNGTAFANLNASGGSLQLGAISGGTSGGTATLTIRFALGATAARTGTLTINGAAQSITFPVTGSWTTWTTLTRSITLAAGTANTVRFLTTGQDLANIDQVSIAP